MNKTASPAKLQDGSWGARLIVEVKPGDTVTIQTKSGKSWSAVVDQIVWSGHGAWVVSLRKPKAEPGRRRCMVVFGPDGTAHTTQHNDRRMERRYDYEDHDA